jgi:hypothetical protein
MAADTLTETLLFIGKIVFLLLLYLFIFSVIRSSTRDLRMAAPVAVDKRWHMPGASQGEEDWEVPAATEGAVEGGMWTLAVVKSPYVPVGSAYALPADGRALAGRSSDMDILLDDTFVSAKHVLFEVNDEGLWVEDLRSTNGTTVNGTRIHEPVLLDVGDVVAVGDTVFEAKVR